MSSPLPPELPDQGLSTGLARLAARREGRFAPETVQRPLADSYALLAADAQVHTHLVALAERLTVERREALAKIEGAPGTAHPNPARRLTQPLVPTSKLASPQGRTMSSTPVASVLFVCIHNAGRSQMAAGFLRHLAGDRVEVRSAGSVPGDRINPSAVAAMAELGIDISDQKPKVLTPEAARASDYIITMGCGDACPYFPGKTYLDWQLEDPAGQGVEAVRPIRDEIKGLIEGLVAEIDAKPKV